MNRYIELPGTIKTLNTLQINSDYTFFAVIGVLVIIKQIIK